MNILYLIGNGFDCNLGLKTSYRNFYDYYLAQKTKEKDIVQFKEYLSERKDDTLWKDLESALGEITSKYKDAIIFRKVLLDILDNLKEYIESEFAKLHFKDGAKEKLCADLCDPAKHLIPATKAAYRGFINKYFTNKEHSINIITFNYTNSLEHILSGYIGKNISSPNRPSIILNNIYHIHGQCNNTIILGVNDESQIGNEIMRKDSDLTDIIIKPKANKSIGSTIDNECARLISDANVICTFGLSFGDTDRIWWNYIKDRLSASSLARVLIYDYCPGLDLSNNREWLRESYRRNARRRLLNNKAENLHEKILCDTNIDVFNLKDFVEIIPPYDVKIMSKVG
mgnify:CR=1 FL=1